MSASSCPANDNWVAPSSIDKYGPADTDDPMYCSFPFCGWDWYHCEVLTQSTQPTMALPSQEERQKRAHEAGDPVIC